MRKRFLTLVALCVAMPALAAPPAELLGAWQMTFAQKADKVLPEAVTSKMLMIVGPDSFAVGDEVGQIDAVPGRKKHRAWLTRTQGPMTGQKSPILWGFDKGELVLATGEDGTWPTSLKPTGQPGNMVARFHKRF